MKPRAKYAADKSAVSGCMVLAAPSSLRYAAAGVWGMHWIKENPQGVTWGLNIFEIAVARARRGFLSKRGKLVVVFVDKS